MKNGQKQTWYDFDAMGNRLKKTVQSLGSNGNLGGAVSRIENYTYDTGDELICMNGTRFKYDLYGNMTEKNDPVGGKTQYTYNSAGRLSKILFPDENEAKYFYDHRGLRIKQVDKNGKTTYYYWDNSPISDAINETDEDGNLTNILFPGFGFKSAYNNNEWRFFITDHLGSVIALSNENGNITDQYEYDEYGNPIFTSGTSYNPYRYTGQDYDAETGLTYLRARYYNMSLGVFTQKDILHKYILSNYIYVKNNPIILKDVTGLYEMGYLEAWIIILLIPSVEGLYKLNTEFSLSADFLKCFINTFIRGLDEIIRRPKCVSGKKCSDKIVHCTANCRAVWCVKDFAGGGEMTASIAAAIVSVVGGLLVESFELLMEKFHLDPATMTEELKIFIRESIKDIQANTVGATIGVTETSKNCFKDCCCEFNG